MYLWTVMKSAGRRGGCSKWPGQPRRSPSDRSWSLCAARACAVQAGDDRLPLTERHSSIILGCRPATFVRHAVKTTSAVLTDTPARFPPVAVRNCWWPSLRCRWCSAMEQFTTGHCRVQHTVTVPSSTKNISVQTVLPFCAFVVTNAFICSPSSFFYLGSFFTQPTVLK